MGAVIGPRLPGSSYKALCNVNMRADNGGMFIAEAIEAPCMAGEQSGSFSFGYCLWPQGRENSFWSFVFLAHNL